MIGYTVIDRYGEVSLPAEISLGLLPTAAGANCNNAPVISFTVGSDEVVRLNGDDSGLTHVLDGCDVTESWEDAWYTLNIPADANGMVRLSTQDSQANINTTLSLYAEDCATRLLCNNDISGADRRSRITFDASDPQFQGNLRILVESDAVGGDFVLTIFTP